jgi:DNA invertase Pin-like site-specific DNA recombinase
MHELKLQIHYVKENFTLTPGSRSMEKFMHGIKVLMAKNYIDNLSDEIKKGMKEKVLQGGFPHKAPIGYLNNPETRGIDIDPKTGPYIKNLFELYATGNFSLRALRRIAIDDGFKAMPSEQKISTSSLERILKNEFYTGFFHWIDEYCKGSHQPVN